MVMEPATFGAIAGSALFSAFGLTRWRRRVSTTGRGVVDLVETYIRGRAEVARERERRATIVAVFAALPPGGSVRDRHADGTELTIRRPPLGFGM